MISKSPMFQDKKHNLWWQCIPGCIHSLEKEVFLVSTVFTYFRFLILTFSAALCRCHVCRLPFTWFVCGFGEQVHRCRCTAQYSRSRPRNSLGSLPGCKTSPHPSCDRTSEGTKLHRPRPVNCRPGTGGPHADRHGTDTDLSTRQACHVWTRGLFVIVMMLFGVMVQTDIQMTCHITLTRSGNIISLFFLLMNAISFLLQPQYHSSRIEINYIKPNVSKVNRKAGCHQTLNAIYVGSLTVWFKHVWQECNLMCWTSVMIVSVFHNILHTEYTLLFSGGV